MFKAVNTNNLGDGQLFKTNILFNISKGVNMATVKEKHIVKKPKKVEKRTPAPLYQVLIFNTAQFLSDLECMLEMFDIVVPVLKENDKTRNKRITEIVNSFKGLSTKTKNIDAAKLQSEIRELNHNIWKRDRANTLFKQNALVMIVSRYDIFVSEVLQAIFRATPDRLKSPDKTLSYEEILQLGSVENAIEKFISKEIDVLLRMSHVEQIKYIDKQLKIDLRDNINCWPVFTEITERRNLFVHTGGKVSRQYINTCKFNEVNLDANIIEGFQLDVDNEYLQKAYLCLLEISMKVSQLVLRKLWPKELKTIDMALNEIGFDFLKGEKWDLAKVVFNFALSLPPTLVSDDAYRKMFVVNKCIALKWCGNEIEFKKLLDDIDWSSSDAKFALAVYVLKGEFKEAELIMSTMNKEKPITEHEYKTWPLFKDFRNTDNFRRAFKKIYRKNYSPELPEIESALIDPAELISPDNDILV